MSELGIGIVGAGGRMGRMLAKAVSEAEGASLVGGVERAGSELLGQDFGQLSGLGDLGLPLGDDPRALIEKADVLIDFTAPEATLATLKLAAEAALTAAAFDLPVAVVLEVRMDAAMCSAADELRTQFADLGAEGAGVFSLEPLPPRSAVKDRARRRARPWPRGPRRFP